MDLKFFQFEETDIFHLRKPIYGTTDAGDYWGVTVDWKAGKEIQLEPMRGDPSQYIRKNDEDVDGVIGNYADDRCIAGKERMEEVTRKTLTRLDSKLRAWDNFEYFGTESKTLAP